MYLKLQRGLDWMWFWSVLCPWYLPQCLAQSEWPINIGGMNQLMKEYLIFYNNFFQISLHTISLEIFTITHGDRHMKTVAAAFSRETECMIFLISECSREFATKTRLWEGWGLQPLRVSSCAPLFLWASSAHYCVLHWQGWVRHLHSLVTLPMRWVDGAWPRRVSLHWCWRAPWLLRVHMSVNHTHSVGGTSPCLPTLMFPLGGH